MSFVSTSGRERLQQDEDADCGVPHSVHSVACVTCMPRQGNRVRRQETRVKRPEEHVIASAALQPAQEPAAIPVQRREAVQLIDLVARCVSAFHRPPSNPLRSEFSVLTAKDIEIEGLLGGGKTTAGQSMQRCLAEKAHIPAFFQEESYDDLMLGEFYEQMDQVERGALLYNAAAFPMQIQMLERRVANHRYARGMHPNETRFYDRMVTGDSLFAILQVIGESIAQKQFEIYLNVLRGAKYQPDYLVFLDVTAAEAERRKNERKRPQERRVPRSYLHKLRIGYYLMLRALALVAQYPIVVIRNDVMHEPEYLLRRIVAAPPTHWVAQVFAEMPVVDLSATEETMNSIFDSLHERYEKHYAAVRPRSPPGSP